ncbi:MAG: 2-amino-4-hydroxy-6-hydroxymethyldihydropteridine diphosphokinase [Aquificota bacterium]|nr:2-amino-4-hydroxy-6-hydroxymethyldihydropteridine diphosphokinase [Aquificota bacterium]
MESRNRIFLSLGTNLGDRLGYLLRAVEGLRGLGKVERVSTLYESDPWGYRDQPPFLNCVVLFRTDLKPRDLLTALKDLERSVGRVPRFRWGPREIDIDIVLYGDLVMDSPDLTIPHPRFRERDFVLVPLLELDPEVRDPQTGIPCSEFLKRLEVKIRPFCSLL